MARGENVFYAIVGRFCIFPYENLLERLASNLPKPSVVQCSCVVAYSGTSRVLIERLHTR